MLKGQLEERGHTYGRLELKLGHLLEAAQDRLVQVLLEEEEGLAEDELSLELYQDLVRLQEADVCVFLEYLLHLLVSVRLESMDQLLD